jgi:hypothetical protein
LERGRLRINPAVVSAYLGDEAVLLNSETGIYFGLDPMGTRIWNLITEGSSEEEIFARLLDECDVAPDQLHSDLAEFVNLLTTKGLAVATHE